MENTVADGSGEGEDDPDETAVQPPASGQPQNVTLSMDATLEVLADSERRMMLQYLIEAPNKTATIRELREYFIEQYAAQEGERPPPNKIELQIHHLHLPKLADVGLVDYDARSEELRYYPNDRLETWLEKVQAEEGN